jgi:hypothetical protein
VTPLSGLRLEDDKHQSNRRAVVAKGHQQSSLITPTHTRQRSIPVGTDELAVPINLKSVANGSIQDLEEQMQMGENTRAGDSDRLRCAVGSFCIKVNRPGNVVVERGCQSQQCVDDQIELHTMIRRGENVVTDLSALIDGEAFEELSLTVIMRCQ